MPIELTRGSENINNFFSAVSELKETNLTAYIAYFIKMFPDRIGNIFLEKREHIIKIRIEHFAQKSDRYDIVMETDRRNIIIEAKLDFKQRKRQIARYIKNIVKSKKRTTLYLLDYGSYKSTSWIRDIKEGLPKRVEIKYVTWSDIHKEFVKLLRFKSSKAIDESAYYIAKEFKNYMEVNNMSSKKRKEVYVRDLQGDSVELFFKYHIYKSQTKFFKSAQGNMYFAPYLTGRAPKDFAERSMIKIEPGIAWIAPILDIQVLRRSGIKEYLKSKGHNKYKEAVKEIYNETRSPELMILLLGEPFQAFLTPISKGKLGIHGAMGARSFTFQELYQAAGRGGLNSAK
ncbi:MAG: hypothetical protein NTZ10_00385 [Candidatus Saganbacteria bacterium]|nr:hypothetical protein [Candidatus Saganbacteria bacterium]